MTTSPNDLPGDWRIRVAVQIAKDVPPAYPGGPSHKAGSGGYQHTTVIDPSGQVSGFTTPSAIALALSIAMKAEVEARELRAGLGFSDAVSPWGTSHGVHFESNAALYDYFERCMVIVAFSFQALEAYCNEVIAEKLTGTFTVQRRKGPVGMTPEELERNLSTDEKLATVLPALLGVASPTGTKVWQDFAALKVARDATIHIKSADSRPKVTPTGGIQDSLFGDFLYSDVGAFPRAAIAMIRYFANPTDPPRWLQLLLDQYGERSQPKAGTDATNSAPCGSHFQAFVSCIAVEIAKRFRLALVAVAHVRRPQHPHRF